MNIDSDIAKSATLADQAYESLAQAIVTGEIAPGSRMLEMELAEKFGMSRGPLREAIRRLEERRLVERTSQRGVRVVSLSEEGLAGIYVVREALEGMACRLAAQCMSNKEIGELRRLLQAHSSVVEKSEAYLQPERDWDFHYRIARGSGNDLIESLLCNDLYQLIKIYRNEHRSTPGRARRALTEHWRILGALEDRDGELAEMLMRRHIAAARDVFGSAAAADRDAEAGEAPVSVARHSENEARS